MSFEIEDWSAVKARAKWNTLLLGNGASIAIHPCFKFHSLYGEAKKRGYLKTAQTIFEAFGEKDFEKILCICRAAEQVNKALGAPNPRIDQAYHDARTALIKTVHAVHCRQADVDLDLLINASRFARQFRQVVTLNYDLTLYWAMMRFLETSATRKHEFQDLFVDGEFQKDHGYSYSTLVYYPHGSLFLVRVGDGASKISANKNKDLLEVITQSWEIGSRPFFVSEGTSEAKRDAILQSSYMRHVFSEVIPKSGNAVVYGLSFDSKDEHITKAASASRPEHIAVSVFSGHSHDEAQEYCAKVASRLRKCGATSRLHFFRSDSPGCWCNPPETDVPF